VWCERDSDDRDPVASVEREIGFISAIMLTAQPLLDGCA
jgi:hypothetical protein